MIGKLYNSLLDNERNNININKYTKSIPLVRYSKGGSMRLFYAAAKQAIALGITNLDQIHKIMELAPFSSGSLVDAIYESSSKEQQLSPPDHLYNFTMSEEEADKLGLFPDERGHRPDEVKYSNHPSHPSKGTFYDPDGRKDSRYYMLSDIGMEDPNYTMFGLVDNNLDPQATLIYNLGIVLPEVTVTPKENYYHNSYDNINIFDKGGKFGYRYDGETEENQLLKLRDLNDKEKEFLQLVIDNTFRGSIGDKVVNSSKIIEDNGPKEYFTSYVESPGFERILDNQHQWWEDRHPYRKYYAPWTWNGGSEKFKLAVTNTDNIPIFISDYLSTGDSFKLSGPTSRKAGYPGINVIGTKLTDIGGGYGPPTFDFTLGHEYAHIFNMMPFVYDGANREALELNRNTNLKINYEDDVDKYDPIDYSHDAKYNEKHSDIWGLKYLLYKEGIYDSRSDKDITLEQVQELRKRYPDLRPMKQMDDNMLLFMLNHVASNNINPFETKRGYLSGNGGRLFYPGGELNESETLSPKEDYYTDLAELLKENAVLYKEALESKGIEGWDPTKSAYNYARDYYSKDYTLPYDPKNKIRLTTDGYNGRFRTGYTTTEVLDSIADAAEEAGLDLSTALGIAGKESNLGYGYNMIKKNNPVNLINLVSGWNTLGMGAPTESSTRKQTEILKKYRNKETITLEEYEFYKNLRDWIIKNINSSHAPKLNPLVEIFKNFKEGLNGNPGDPNNRLKAIEMGKVLIEDPAIKEYLLKTGRISESPVPIDLTTINVLKDINKIQGLPTVTTDQVIVPNLKHKYGGHLFENGGEEDNNIYFGKTLPIIEVDLSPEQKAMKYTLEHLQTGLPYNNYNTASDMAKWRAWIANNITDKGVSNCTLNATNAYGDIYTRAHALNVINDPMYEQITNQEDIVPGVMMIQSLPGMPDSVENKYHSATFSGVADKDYINVFGDYVQKGDSLYRYSNGDYYVGAYRERPKLALMKNHGKTNFRYFRPKR